MSAPSTHAKGVVGEEAAAAYLAAHGWTVLERNFRWRAGEIDIIAGKGDQVAFVEVKAWSGLPREALEQSIDRRKQVRIARTARLFLSQRPHLAGRRMRFDVVFLGRGAREIVHIENAFNGGID